MNNLPSNMKRHTVFRDNTYSHTVVFEDNYPLPAEGDIKMQVRYGTRILDVDPEISVTGQRVTYTYTPEMLAKLPGIVQQYLLLNDVSFIGGELGVKVGYGEQEISETHVTVTDGEVTLVQVMGLALVTEQVSIATDAAAEATQGATTATEQASIATNGASTATTKAGEAEASAEAAVSAQQAAEAARDVALANTVERVYVATYAQAEPYFTGPMPREVYVQADEAYYEGDSSWYKYDPQLGTALFGIDFNYKN